MTEGPKILTIDIEQSPHLAWTFETRRAFISPAQIKEPTRTICFAAKWLHEKRTMFWSEYHHPGLPILKAFDLLDQADVVVTYNGDNYDLPHLGREFRKLGLGDPSPYVSVDLYKVIKKREKWMSHRLGYIAEQLNLPQKLQNDGMLLWRECMGDFGEERQRQAWNAMRRYNKQDVVVTGEVFLEYRPVIKNIPHISLFLDEDRPGCPDGHGPGTQQGFRRTKTRRYPRYQCQECGRWFSDNRSDKGVSTT